MYSYEDRMKAVKLYIKYDLCVTQTVRELGYPVRAMLVRWYKEYLETGQLHKKSKKKFKYTEHQMRVAVNYYLEHGRNIARTVRAVGYPSRDILREWIDVLAPGIRKARMIRSGVVQFSTEQKKTAVIELCARVGSAATIANNFGASRNSLYKWTKQLLGEEKAETMGKFNKPTLSDDKDTLLAEFESLKQQIYRQQMELDILNKAAEIIKKDPGIDPRKLANKEKANLIDALRMMYPSNELLRMTGMAKSSYFYHRETQNRPDKYAVIREDVKKVFGESQRRYGYRRVHAKIKDKGTVVSEKVIRKIMKEEQLVVYYR